jgi:DNA-binding PadR family transcriptional regulator
VHTNRINFTLKRSKIVRVALFLTTRGALLQVLRSGPGYGLQLIRRLEEKTGECLSEARVYPGLKQLAREDFVRAVSLAPKGRRGARARIYYHLTQAGAAAAEAERAALLALLALAPTPQATAHERERMAERILEAEELAEAAEDLRAGRAP